MEYYTGYIVLFFTLIQFINALINLIFSQQIKSNNEPINDKISILIPARNEEHNIGNILRDLTSIKGLNLEIIVFDDMSDDNTANIIKGYSSKDHRIKFIQSRKLKSGWLGKNYACHQLALNAAGKYFLFIDADVRIKKRAIVNSIQLMKKHQLGLLSIFPKQILISLGEKLTVPNMNFILLSLLPLIFVRISPFSSHSAANGQFMLFDSTIYKENLPHQMFKNAAIEDIHIARFLKKQKIPTVCMLGNDNITCRMYKTYHEAINGFSKNVFMFFGNSTILSFLFVSIILLGFIPIVLINFKVLILYVTLIIATRVFISISSRQNVFLNVLLMPLQNIALSHIVWNALRAKMKKEHLWKDRNIY